MKKITGLCFAFLALFLNTCKVSAQVALAFNGSSNYVSTNGTPVSGNQARTVDAWIKTTSTITTQMVICDWGVISPNGSRFTMNVINNKLRIEVGGVGFTGTTNVNTGQWVHVTAVYSPSITSGANAFLYINGNLEAAASFTGYAVLTTTNTVGFRIGVRVDGINYFNGAVEEVKVYNYARTQAQIAADTLEYCAPQSGLVAYYKLNEGVPNANNTGSITAIDYSGNGNNGTLNSFTLTGTSSNWVPGRVSSGASLISASPANYICSGNSVSLTTNAVANFTWSTGNTTSTLIAITPTSTGNYSVTVTNTLNNCTQASVITITVNSAPPTVTVLASQNPICTGASTSFSATGAVSYSWTGGIVNMQLFTPSVTTSYTLSAANACGLVNSVHTISVAPLPVTATAGTTSVCQGYTCNLTASAAATTYSWLPVSQTGSSIVVSPSSTTIYTVTASNGTCVGTQTLQLNTVVTASVSINNSVVSICNGQTASITASGAGTNGTYAWSPGAGNSASVVVNPTVTTLYTVYGTNSLGCTSSAQIPVVVLINPTVSISTSNTLVCSGETVTLNALGAGTYTWSTAANGPSVAVIPAGNITVYSVTGTSASNTCTASETIAIAAITPSVSFTSSLAICSGANATLNASGAATYTWNNVPLGASGQIVYTPATTSTYTLVANTTSLNTNCLSTHLATVFVNPNPTVSIVAAITTSICKGETNTLTVSGASSYTWLTIGSNSTQISVTPSATTIYTVVGVTASGCAGNAQLQVKVNNCTGVSERIKAVEFAVFPNPATNAFYISSATEMVLELYNYNGQLMRVLRIENGNTLVDVKNLNPGLYFIKEQNSGSASGRKIIIN